MKNAFTVVGDYAEIALSQGKTTLVDITDLPGISGLRWYAIVGRHSFYAMAKARQPDGSRKLVCLHRLIMGEPKGLFVDHADGNGLNNRRSNLRTATAHQNAQNRRRATNNRSGFKGVSWHSQARKWRACIRSSGSRTLVSLGLYETKEAAHAAYVAAAEQMYGRFARSS